MVNRREFLRRSSLIALAPTIPGFLAAGVRGTEADRIDRVLVVLQLDGGNDGINTVVPYRDDGYDRHRRVLRLPAERLLKLDDSVALHPSMRGMADLFQGGQLAIIQGVGYPNPNRSHEVSMAIWHTARFEREEHKQYGWLGRALDESPPPVNHMPAAVFVGRDSIPNAIIGRKSITSSLVGLDELALTNPVVRSQDTRAAADGSALDFVRRTALDAYGLADLLKELTAKSTADARYPATPLANQMRTIAQLIKAGLTTPVYYAIQSSYDTHALQLPAHADLLEELAGALQAFMKDLTAAGEGDRVAVLCFSEFGRRVAENASSGTDHGAAGPVFLAGAGVRAGLHGSAPRLTDLDDRGDLKMNIDFRRVYASILAEWLRLPAASVVGSPTEPLDLFR